MMIENECPECGQKLILWYGLGGRRIVGCSSISCTFKKEA